MRNFISDTKDWLVDKLGLFGGFLLLLLGGAIWAVGSIFILYGAVQIPDPSGLMVAAITLVTMFWPVLLVLILNIVGYLVDQVADAKNRKLEREQAEAERLEKAQLKAVMQSNASLIRAKIKEVEEMLLKQFEAELQSNIEEAKRAYPTLIETVKSEEAFLAQLSRRHPNIAGFVQTRSQGDSKKSDVAKLGSFLSKLEV